jgi:hypothetical protein
MKPNGLFVVVVIKVVAAFFVVVDGDRLLDVGVV